MFKAAILDVDGVILGHKQNINFPLPSYPVQRLLQSLSEQGIPVSLCSAKAYFAIKDIISACGIEGLHITDAGALLVDTKNSLTYPNYIPTDAAKKILAQLFEKNIYTEFYASESYYAFPDQEKNMQIREGRINNLGHTPTILNPMTESLPELTKIYTLPDSAEDVAFVKSLGISMQYKAALHWGNNPSLIPAAAFFFTNKDATKETGAQKIAELTGISLSETLAIGDSTNDWSFMKLCGYKATLANGTPELKRTVLEASGYVSEKSVDDDGVVEIIEFFQNR